MTIATTSLKAKDVMTPEPVCVEPATDVRRVLQIFAANDISGAPVLGSDSTVAGVVSMSDIVRLLVDGTSDVLPAYLFDSIREQESGDAEGFEAEPALTTTVEEIMSHSAETVIEDTQIADVASLMHESRIHRVVVTDEADFPRGIITSLDLVGVMANAGSRANG